MKIEGIANFDGNKIKCFGTIEIKTINNKQAFVTWNLLDENEKSIAGVSKTYYWNDETSSKQSLVKLIIENILKYRIGREKIFTAINVMD